MKKEEEKVLRENIRQMIRFVKQKKTDEETQLRGIINSLIGVELKEIVKEASVPDVITQHACCMHHNSAIYGSFSISIFN